MLKVEPCNSIIILLSYRLSVRKNYIENSLGFIINANRDRMLGNRDAKTLSYYEAVIEADIISYRF